MDRIRTEHTKQLEGTVVVSGAKNAALPCMAAALLTQDQVILRNLPPVADIRTMTKVLNTLGTRITPLTSEDVAITISQSFQCDQPNDQVAPYDLVKTMRASILVLGPLLARFGQASVSLPGGCAIGARPVDLHLAALEKMGAHISVEEGYVKGSIANGKKLKGMIHTFPQVSVGATENLILAATLAEGMTILQNAAQEPEVSDLANLLNKMGAEIEGIGTSTLRIHGCDELHGAVHDVIPDRIEAGTFMCAVAATSGQILIEKVDPQTLEVLIGLLGQMGCQIKSDVSQKTILISRSPQEVLRPISITTEPYPGFPTDLQAQLMSICLQAEGESIIEENIFENRFQHAMELERLGGKITIKGHAAIITGKSRLSGTTVMASDLRASASLVIAGMCASGFTEIERVYHLDRGYAQLDEKLRRMGALIERIRDKKK